MIADSEVIKMIPLDNKIQNSDSLQCMLNDHQGQLLNYKIEIDELSMQIIFQDQAEFKSTVENSNLLLNKFDVGFSIKKLNLDIFSRKNQDKWTEIGCLTLQNIDFQLHLDESKKHVQLRVDNMQLDNQSSQNPYFEVIISDVEGLHESSEIVENKIIDFEAVILNTIDPQVMYFQTLKIVLNEIEIFLYEDYLQEIFEF